jgi:hypothetical protein
MLEPLALSGHVTLSCARSHPNLTAPCPIMVAPRGLTGNARFNRTGDVHADWAPRAAVGLGAMLGATGANGFLCQANGSGQADSDHASSRTDPNGAEHLTGIYGSDAQAMQPGSRAVTATCRHLAS